MEFVTVISIAQESDLAFAVSLLEAYNIPYYVHNQGFGGLYPGLQISHYNARYLRVPVSHAAEAKALLEPLLPEPVIKETALTWHDKLRVFLETLLLGWSFPNRRKNISHTTPSPASHKKADK